MKTHKPTGIVNYFFIFPIEATHHACISGWKASVLLVPIFLFCDNVDDIFKSYQFLTTRFVYLSIKFLTAQVTFQLFIREQFCNNHWQFQQKQEIRYCEYNQNLILKTHKPTGSVDCVQISFFLFLIGTKHNFFCFKFCKAGCVSCWMYKREQFYFNHWQFKKQKLKSNVNAIQI